MASLFSAKSIVLICSFSFTVMFYFIGGFDVIISIEIPTLTMPEIGNPFEYKEPEGKINFETENCKTASQFKNTYWQENCQQYEQYRDASVLKKNLLESASISYGCDSSVCGESLNLVANTSDCDKLITLWETNIGWTIRPEIAIKILNSCKV